MGCGVIGDKMKRKFKVNFELDGWDISDGIIELDQKVIDNVDDEWHEAISSKINTPEEIASFIAYNICVNNADLISIDGFANLTNDLAKMIEWPQGLDDYMVTAKEIN